MLTIPTTFREINFWTNFRIFCNVFFAKNAKNKKFQGLNASRLEFKLRTQRGMTFLAVTFFCIMTVKTLLFFAKTRV